MTRRLSVLILAAVLFGGCGIVAEETPRSVDPPPRPFRALASPTPPAPATAGAVAEQLYFVKDNHLVAVTRQVTVPLTVEALIATLQAGPTDAERDAGLSSALLGSDVVTTVRIDSGVAAVELASPMEGTGRSDDVLAYAQLVCTLMARSDIIGVSFTRDGQPTGVPRGDSSLSQDPLTAADYANLLSW